MINNQRGFTLFEFAISMMISTMLMSAAFTIYNQVNKAAATVQKVTTNDTKIMILRDRLSADFEGISPLWFTEEMYEKLKSPEQATAKAANSDSKIKRNNFLYAQSSDKNLSFLTFVTTNPLQMYGENTARFVRVVYTLIPDTQNKDVFKLMRKEDKKPSADFDIEKMKEGTFYELASNITKLSIEFGYIDQTKKEDSGKKLSFTWAKEWDKKKKKSAPDGKQDSKQKEAKGDDTKKKDDDETPDLPEAIKLKVSFFHDMEKPAIDYEIFFMIPINQEQGLKSFAEKRSQAQQKAKGDQAKSPTDGGAPGSPNPAIQTGPQVAKLQPAENKPGVSRA
ncbi:MAG: prepilin-type N-terminal cleavage/methylation domain-containing protein [Candidatus Dependentiae bacterium]|nr:prepilin-type N-terminal cleavage/methylation domain-containing protein [Candidatus Dependentiae bacterium]